MLGPITIYSNILAVRVAVKRGTKDTGVQKYFKMNRVTTYSNHTRDIYESYLRHSGKRPVI